MVKAKSKKRKSVKKVQKRSRKPAVKKAPKKVKVVEKRAVETVEVKLNLLKDPILIQLLKQTAGDNGYTVARTIAEEELTDDEIAKRTGIRLNLVRRILYDLYDNRVVSYRRIRDESSGWYIYYWKVEPSRALSYVNTNRRLLLQKLEEQLEHERSTMFFSCNDGCPKVSYDRAVESDFKCTMCKGKLQPYDNSGVITSLERKVQAIRQQLMRS